MLFAADVLERNPKAKIIYDVKSTRLLKPWIKQNGGVPVMARTGHSFIKAKIKETGALLAGEMSGHVFFRNAGTASTTACTPAPACWKCCPASRTPARCSMRCPMRSPRRNST